MDNKCLQQIENFKYHHCEISYKNVKDIQQKLSISFQTLRTANNNCKPTWVQQSSRTEVYYALAVPLILNRSEILTVRQNDNKQLTSFQMKFFRTAGHTLFCHRRNEKILEELKLEPVDEKLIGYISNWLRRVIRMKNNKMPK